MRKQGPSVVAPGHRCTNSPEVVLLVLLVLVAALLVFQAGCVNVSDLGRGQICCLDSFPSNISSENKLNPNGFNSGPVWKS